MKQYYVYILTNKKNTVLYTGSTDNLIKRVLQHRNKQVEGFTKRYNVNKLVYFEIFFDPLNMVSKERAIKNLVRRKKIELIINKNLAWVDLYDSLLE